MKIALCDDEKSYHGKILELIGQYRETKPGCSLFPSSFYSGKDLLNHVDEYGGFDLYILDCIMPGMDGIELGAALRRRDDHGMLIYLTTSPDFALDSYRVDAFDYLLKPVDKELFSWAHEAQERGAGEILFTSMNHDGVKTGFANEALAQLATECAIPVIASGGAGAKEHFLDVFTRGKADAALAASVFHFGEIRIPELKSYLCTHGIPMRK